MNVYMHCYKHAHRRAAMTPVELGDPIHYTWAAVGAAFGGAYAAVRWWFHVRRLNNADKVDGGVTASIKFVLDELHKEIQSLKTEVALLKEENAELRRSRHAIALAMVNEDNQ